MPRIEQAVFTSMRTQSATGYHLVAWSPGLNENQRRELSQWGPSHDSLLPEGLRTGSVNFHRLETGGYCVSHTWAAGMEYSGRSGPRIATHFLVVSSEDLLRFSNNPFALYNAAKALGVGSPDPVPGATLEALELGGKAPAVDQTAVAHVLRTPGPWPLAHLLGAVLSSQRLGVVTRSDPARLMAAMLNCLPVSCRTELSFTTGLKHSPRRPFRIVVADSSGAEQRKLAREPGWQLAVLEGAPATPPGTWAIRVAGLLTAGRISQVASHVSSCPAETTLAQLDQWSATLVHGRAAEPEPRHVAAAPKATECRSDPAHAGRTTALLQATLDVEVEPSRVLALHRPEAREQLELLDDTVFESVAGKPGALETLRVLWPKVLLQLGPALLEESREHYLRHTLAVWRGCVEGDQVSQPAVATAALEVLCLLFDS